jgi:hypothetical protein
LTVPGYSPPYGVGGFGNNGFGPAGGFAGGYRPMNGGHHHHHGTGSVVSFFQSIVAHPSIFYFNF